MKNLSIVAVLFSISFIVHGQIDIKAEIEGSLKVQDKIELGNAASENTLVGLKAGDSIVIGIPAFFNGTLNSFYGFEAGRACISCFKNTYIGAFAGANDTLKDANTFVGASVGRNNSGEDNTFVGAEVGEFNSGSQNTFVGHWAGRENLDGFENTFIGRSAGRDNTSGKFNTFLGYEAGCENTTGDNNTGLGFSAGYFTTTGFDNTFVGMSAGEQNTVGYRNTSLGARSGIDNLTGTRNTLIGYNAHGSNIEDSQNQIVIGYNAIGVGDNIAVIGNDSITHIYMNQNGDGIIHANATIVSSDLRLKRDVVTSLDNLGMINSLRPVQFSFKKNVDSHEFGFIAQEVLKEIPSLVVQRENGFYGVKYEQIIALLTGAVQEQNDKIEKLEEQISTYEDEFRLIRQELDKLKKQ